MGYNPAGLAAAPKPLLQTAFTNGIGDDHLSFTGYAHQLPFGVLTAGFLYYDAGTIDLNLSNGVTGPRKAEQDFVEMAGLSVPLPAGLAAGATFKYYSLTLAEAAHAAGAALDGGLLWHSPVRGLNLGASLQNLGQDVKFEQDGDPLPFTTRAGLAYAFTPPAGARHLLTADLIKIRNRRTSAGAGFELGLPVGGGEADLRLGYLLNRDSDSLTAGVGLKEGRLSLSYALGVKRSVSNVHNVSLGVEF